MHKELIVACANSRATVVHEQPFLKQNKNVLQVAIVEKKEGRFKRTSNRRSNFRFRCRSSRWYSMRVLILPALKTARIKLVVNRGLRMRDESSIQRM